MLDNLFPTLGERIYDYPAFECLDSDCAQTRRTEEPISYNFDGPPKRSTVLVPSGGFSVIRFRADNPGIWMMHCHTLSHAVEGQALLLNVTDQGIPPVPKNFPTCPVSGAMGQPQNLENMKTPILSKIVGF